MPRLRRFILFPIIAFSIIFTFATTNVYAYDISINVAPSVLNIQSESLVVTVQTDIAYGAVVGSSVFLNGVSIDYWKADDRGNFVAKFLSDEIKTLDGLVIGDYNELVLTGFDTDGVSFIGIQEIKVINIKSQGKK